MKPDRAERNRRYTLTFDQQMREAEASCVPCKLCGGKAVISDAGPGYGYNINCEHWMQRRNECFQGGTRISGWAYNVADRWNELNAIPAADARETESQTVRAEALKEAAALFNNWWVCAPDGSNITEDVQAAILAIINKDKP